MYPVLGGQKNIKGYVRSGMTLHKNNTQGGERDEYDSIMGKWEHLF